MTQLESDIALARFGVAGVHHMYASPEGVRCMCGYRAGTNRRFTEHVIDVFVDKLEGITNA